MGFVLFGSRVLPGSGVGSVGFGAVMEGAVGLPDPQGAIGFEFDLPSALVNQMMMTPTQRNQIVQISWSAVFPFHDVMDLAPIKRTITTIPTTPRIHDSEGEPLGISGGPISPPNRQGDPVGADDESLHISVTTQSGHC